MSEKIYAFLLNLYPSRFREAYEDASASRVQSNVSVSNGSELRRWMSTFSCFNSTVGATLIWLSMATMCTTCKAVDHTGTAHEAAVESNLQFQNEIRGVAGQRMLLKDRMNALHVPGV